MQKEVTNTMKTKNLKYLPSTWLGLQHRVGTVYSFVELN